MTAQTVTIATSPSNRKELAEAFGQNQSAVRRLESITKDVTVNIPKAVDSNTANLSALQSQVNALQGQVNADEAQLQAVEAQQGREASSGRDARALLADLLALEAILTRDASAGRDARAMAAELQALLSIARAVQSEVSRIAAQLNDLAAIEQALARRDSSVTLKRIDACSIGKAVPADAAFTQVTNGDTNLMRTSVALGNGASTNTATLTNAPAATNPTKWIPINDNGTTRYIPAW